MSRGPSASVHDEAVARENPDCALGYRQQRWERRSTLPTLLVWTISTRLRPHPDTTASVPRAQVRPDRIGSGQTHDPAALGRTKSYAGRRKVPIAGVLRDLLVDVLIHSERHELIFARPDGRPFSPYTLAARANRHWNDAGRARVTLHECRHTFAALMVSAMSAAGKFNAKVLQTLMGHSSITVTFDRYGHLMPRFGDRGSRPPRSLSRGRRGGCPRRRWDGPREKCGKNFGAAERSPAVSGGRRRRPAELRSCAVTGGFAGSSLQPAEGVGFEPTGPVDPALRFSRPVHSTALPPLRGCRS